MTSAIIIQTNNKLCTITEECSYFYYQYTKDNWKVGKILILILIFCIHMAIYLLERDQIGSSRFTIAVILIFSHLKKMLSVMEQKSQVIDPK